MLNIEHVVIQYNLSSIRTVFIACSTIYAARHYPCYQWYLSTSKFHTNTMSAVAIHWLTQNLHLWLWYDSIPNLISLALLLY